jgi:hypothetical protein
VNFRNFLAESGAASFLPYADEVAGPGPVEYRTVEQPQGRGHFDVKGYLDGYDSLEWDDESQERWDPDGKFPSLHLVKRVAPAEHLSL